MYQRNIPEVMGNVVFRIETNLQSVAKRSNNDLVSKECCEAMQADIELLKQIKRELEYHGWTPVK